MQVSIASERPYKGLAPYAEEDASIFFGRDHDRQLIVANLYAARLTILYGPSGVGKSSVLQAGVAAHLHQQPGHAVVVFDDWHADPAAGLRQLVTREIQRVLQKQIVIDPAMPLDAFLKECTVGLRGFLAIILDQFEEYSLYQTDDASPHSFAAAFARTVNGANNRVRFIISLREDALSRLDHFQRRIPGLFSNYLRVEHLTRDAAREAITRPLEVYNQELPPEQRVTIEEDLVTTTIDQVRTGNVAIGGVERGPVAPRVIAEPAGRGAGGVEAHLLQLVLTRLWDEETKRKSRVLRLSTLVSLGGAAQIVRTHLDASMARLKPFEQEVCARIFYFLVTPSGTKIAHTAADLASYSAISSARVEAVVDRLARPDLRVLRGVTSGAREKEETRYEIFHDVLAPALLDWRARYFGRSTLSKTLFLIAAIALLGIIAIQLVPSLHPVILALARATTLVVLHTVLLLQIYRWFYRYVSLTVRSFSMFAFGGPNLGMWLGVLWAFLWYAWTVWPSGADPGNPLGTLSPEQYLRYLFSLAATLFFGFLVFLAMRGAGQLTARLFKDYNSGFFGFYFVTCAVIAFLAILNLLGITHVRGIFIE